MKVYVFDIRKVTDEIVMEVKTKLPSRFKRASIYKNKDDLLRTVAGSYMLLKIMPPFNDYDFKYGAHNKPKLKNNKCFNISHSGIYTVLVVDDNEIGVDIEEITETANIRCIGFIKNEVENVQETPYEELFKIWCHKESIVKLTGDGLGTISKVKLKETTDSIYNESVTYNNYVISVSSYNKLDKLEIIEL